MPPNQHPIQKPLVNKPSSKKDQLNKKSVKELQALSESNGFAKKDILVYFLSSKQSPIQKNLVHKPRFKKDQLNNMSVKELLALSKSNGFIEKDILVFFLSSKLSLKKINGGSNYGNDEWRSIVNGYRRNGYITDTKKYQKMMELQPETNKDDNEAADKYIQEMPNLPHFQSKSEWQGFLLYFKLRNYVKNQIKYEKMWRLDPTSRDFGIIANEYIEDLYNGKDQEQYGGEPPTVINGTPQKRITLEQITLEQVLYNPLSEDKFVEFKFALITHEERGVNRDIETITYISEDAPTYKLLKTNNNYRLEQIDDEEYNYIKKVKLKVKDTQINPRYTKSVKCLLSGIFLGFPNNSNNQH